MFAFFFNQDMLLFEYLAHLHIFLYRADYNPDQYLWEKDFTLAGRAYKRQDLEASMGMISSH
jgi:hypothetical protein